MKRKPLLSKDTSNAKLAKTHDLHGRDWETLILYMAPAEVVYSSLTEEESSLVVHGVRVSLCPASTEGCRRDCLFYQGRARLFKEVNEARIRKAKQFILEPLEFFAQLHGEVRRALAAATRKGKRLAIRLNGTTDIDWTPFVRLYPDVQFYDYTKTARGMAFARGTLPENYHITFSRSEENRNIALRVLRAGGNVAVVVDSKVDVDWSDARLIDGDLHDARFLDGRSSDGRIVVLRAKGSLKGQGSDTGFCLNQAGWDSFIGSVENSIKVSA
jgi:hypothetical protein